MKAFVVLFSCGFIHLVAGQCRHVQKAEENEKINLSKSDVWLPDKFLSMMEGCKYNGKEISPGRAHAFPDICEVCACSEESQLICCVDGFTIDRNTLPKDCVVKKVGCYEKAVLKDNENMPCKADIAAVGRK